MMYHTTLIYAQTVICFSECRPFLVELVFKWFYKLCNLPKCMKIKQRHDKWSYAHTWSAQTNSDHLSTVPSTTGLNTARTSNLV